jgi:SAM-dependent methyltransferase
MFWFERNHPNVVYADLRSEQHELCDGRDLVIHPMLISDFRQMPFADETFALVIFDPPHLVQLGTSSWTAKKYGRLFSTWRDDLRSGFDECWRVLKPQGVLIFKWNEYDITVSEILKIFPVQPLIGHRSGKVGKTHWLTFLKFSSGADESLTRAATPAITH